MRSSTLSQGVLREVVSAARAERVARRRLEGLWVELYEEGVSTNRLALASGVPVKRVLGVLERQGVPRRFKNSGEYR